MDLFYYAAIDVHHSSQMFFVLFLEFAKLGPAERRFLCNGLRFFKRATDLMRQRLPEVPDALPKFVVETPATDSDEPDEKDFLPTSPFAALYGFKEKKKKEVKATVAQHSRLQPEDMVYLLETLTIIVQNAILPEYEKPHARDRSVQRKPASPAKAAAKPSAAKQPAAADAKKPATAEAKKPAAAPAAAASGKPAAEPSAKPEGSQSASPAAKPSAAPTQAAVPSSSPAQPSSRTDVHVFEDQIDLMFSDVFPTFIRSDSGMYCMKQFILRICTANRVAVKEQVGSMINTFLSLPNMSYFHLKRFAELVNSIFCIRDGCSEDRIDDYMEAHMSFIRYFIESGHYSVTLKVPLEALALVVNTGTKEVKAGYKRNSQQFFTSELKQLGKFQDHF